MAISFVGSASANSINGGAVTITLPGSMSTDDLIIAAFASPVLVDVDLTMNTAGYTEVADLYSNDGIDGSLGVFYKFHNGSDTTAEFTATGGAANGNSGVLMVFRGVKLAASGGPFDVTSTTATGQNTAVANPPSIDHSGASGIWVVAAGGAGHAAGTAGTYTAPANYTTNAITKVGDDDSDSVVALCYRTDPADPEDPGAFTFNGTDDVSYAWCAVTMALSPAATAGFEGWGIPV